MELQENIIVNKRYRLKKRIGQGGFSVVWKAEDMSYNNASVAIKVFAPDKGLDDVSKALFKEEYQLTRQLEDGRLLRMTDYFEYNDSPCLVMPYMERGSAYYVLLKQGGFSEKEIARMLYQICGGLNYLHSQPQPILHLDIKPDNILLTYSGDYVLADFGISARLRSSLLRASRMKGFSLAQSSPERALNQGIGKPADIFSLGVTICELCTEEVPWGGQGGSAVVNELPFPELEKPKYTLRLEQLMQACMQLEPEKRPTAQQIEKIALNYLNNNYWELGNISIPQNKPKVSRDTKPLIRTDEEITCEYKYEKVGNKYGYNDKNGYLVIDYQFDEAYNFFDGRAKVRIGSKYGYIDKTGDFIVECKYDEADSFSNGVALVKISGKWGVIDKMGKLLLACQYESIKPLKKIYLTKQSNAWGIRRHDSDTVIAYIDLIELNGLYALKQGNIRWRIIDSSANEVAEYDELKYWCNSIFVAKKNGKHGFIDRNNKVINDFKYDSLGSLSENLAYAKRGAKYGFINDYGKEAIEFKFDNAWWFKSGLSKVQNNNKYGYIDKTGKIVIQCKYEQAQDFKGDFAQVEKNGKTFKINKKGAIHREKEYYRNFIARSLSYGFPIIFVLAAILSIIWHYTPENLNSYEFRQVNSVVEQINEIVENTYSNTESAQRDLYENDSTVLKKVYFFSFLGTSHYIGEYQSGKRENIGIFYYANGDKYKGEWKNDSMSGSGILTCKDTVRWCPNTVKYIGEWKNNIKSGEGKCYDSVENLIYWGLFVNDKPIETYPLERKRVNYYNGYYDGTLKEDKYHGYGKREFLNGDIYEGEWKNGRREGKGIYNAGVNVSVFNCHECKKYEGYWKNNEKHGRGKCFDKNGKLLYEGNFEDDMPTSLYPQTGSVRVDETNGYCVGTFLKGKIHGKGNYYWNNGNSYEGEWKNGDKAGFGKFYWENGDRYEGDWKDDNRTGQGKYFWSDRAWCEGEWVNDDRNGNGTFYIATDYIKKGYYIKYCRNCVKYVGEYDNDKQSGWGKCYDKYGNLIYAGYFSNDRPTQTYPGVHTK